MKLNETNHAGGFILSEANRTRSRDNITIATGQGVLQAGTVLGRLTAGGAYVELDPDADTGAEVAAGILYARVDATNAAADAVALVRDCEVNRHELLWGDAEAGEITAATAELAELGVILR